MTRLERILIAFDLCVYATACTPSGQDAKIQKHINMETTLIIKITAIVIVIVIVIVSSIINRQSSINRHRHRHRGRRQWRCQFKLFNKPIF